MSAWPAIRMLICMVRIHVSIFAIDDHSNAEADVIYAALVMLLLEFKLNLQCQILIYKKKKKVYSFDSIAQYKHLTQNLWLSAWLNQECLCLLWSSGCLQWLSS